MSEILEQFMNLLIIIIKEVMKWIPMIVEELSKGLNELISLISR